MTDFSKSTSVEKWLLQEKRQTVIANRLRSYVEERELFAANIYHLPLPLLFNSLYNEGEKESSEVSEVSGIVEATDINKKGLTCLLCGLLFSSHEEQVNHFKSSFHYFNLQRKSKNRPVFSFDEYASREASELETELEQDIATEEQNIACEAEREEEQGSSSETEDDSEEEKVSESEYDRYEYQDESGIVTKVFPNATGPIFNVSLASLSPWEFTLSLAMFPKSSSFQSKSWNLTSDHQSDNSELWNRLHRHLSHLQSHPLTAIFILRSGRFAGAIFDNRKPHSTKTSLLVHKVIRRYTVRAKAGGKQSSHDNKHSKARSVGAMLRRYGEKALQEDIQDIFTQWRDYLQSCGLILIASTKSMRYQLFKDSEETVNNNISNNTSVGNTDSNLLSREDPRVSFVPFVVERPTSLLVPCLLFYRSKRRSPS